MNPYPNAPYTLHLTSEDIKTIAFVSGRYGWSDNLSWCVVGKNNLSESEAWEWYEAVEADTEGGHDLFPLLSGDSDLCRKLIDLRISII